MLKQVQHEDDMSKFSSIPTRFPQDDMKNNRHPELVSGTHFRNASTETHWNVGPEL